VLNGAGHDASAIEDGEGEFNVVADGTLVFSKRREGRFPEEEEILALVDAPD
jgi:selT/selW/selH-like putative selenoprotein